MVVTGREIAREETYSVIVVGDSTYINLVKRYGQIINSQFSG